MNNEDRAACQRALDAYYDERTEDSEVSEALHRFDQLMRENYPVKFADVENEAGR